MIPTFGLPWLTIVGFIVVQTRAAIVGHIGRMNVEVESRQTSTLPSPPPQCATSCPPVLVNEINTGCTSSPECSCTSSFLSGFFSCFSCVGQVENLSDYTSVQGILDTLTEECAILGFTALPKLTFPGQNPNRTLSSAFPTGTSRTSASSTRAPGLPISTGSGATSSSPPAISSLPPQSTITSVSPTSTQNTVVSTTSSTIPGISSGDRTMSIQFPSIVLASTVLTWLSLYLAL